MPDARDTATDRVARLFRDVPERPTQLEARAGLRRALGDETLEICLWDGGGYLDCVGARVALDTLEPGRAVTLVGYDSMPLAALVHDAALLDAPELLEAVVGAARIGLAKDRLQDELEAKIAELEASRARIVEAADAERRRLERNLHDGAQQRLVGVSHALHLARAKLAAGDPTAGSLLESACDQLKLAHEELRELARGLHPVLLTERGLTGALPALATRATLPVEVVSVPAERLAPPVEIALFYVASEALANTAKHAGATHAEVSVVRENGAVVLEVVDDGRGGAELAAGFGLRGLADRIEAVGGRLELDSPPGAGTRLRAVVPA